LVLASLLILCTGLAFAPRIDIAEATMSTDVTFYIKADGNVHPQPAPISTSDNVTYTFSAGWTYLGGNSALVVERDNIAIDGAEFTLRGKAPNSNGITLVGRTNVTLKNAVITEFSRGIWLSGSSNNTIMGSDIASNLYGVELDRSSRNAICQNNIVGSSMPGIWLHGESANNNSIVENNITSNYYGVRITESSSNFLGGNIVADNYNPGIVFTGFSDNNTIVGNNLTANAGYGLMLYESSDNLFYHNNVRDNGKTVYIGTSGYANFWNSSIEGNYWSDYAGSDSTRDGLGDVPYAADANNTDYHPLMGVFSEFSATSEHHVQIVSNSSIFGFHFT